MDSGTASFLVWSVTMVIFIAALFLVARKGRKAEKEMDEAMAECLPEINRIAKANYKKRFGRAPTGSPESNWDANRKSVGNV